jgi:hypothetical protein
MAASRSRLGCGTGSGAPRLPAASGQSPTQPSALIHVGLGGLLQIQLFELAITVARKIPVGITSIVFEELLVRVMGSE